MFDDNRTVTVTLLDGETKIMIDKTPSDATANSILSRLLALDILKDQNTSFAIKCNGTILTPTAYVDDDIELVVQPRKARPFLSIFLFFFFSVIHLAPIVFYCMNYKYWYCLSVYVLGLLVMGVFCLILKPSQSTFSDFWNSGPTNIVFIDVFILFLRSLSPGFRLEQVLTN